MKITGTIEYEINTPNGPDDVDTELETIDFNWDGNESDIEAELASLLRHVDKRQQETKDIIPLDD